MLSGFIYLTAEAAENAEGMGTWFDILRCFFAVFASLAVSFI